MAIGSVCMHCGVCVSAHFALGQSRVLLNALVLSIRVHAYAQHIQTRMVDYSVGAWLRMHACRVCFGIHFDLGQSRVLLNACVL